MKSAAKLILCLVVALVLVGCDEKGTTNSTPPSVTPPAASNNGELAHAQPKLPAIRLYMGSETVNAEQALNWDQQRCGMMFRTNLTDEDAMIFVFPGPYRASFWMKNCPESLSAAYIDPEGVIQEIHHFEKQDTNSVVANSDNIQYVLEMKDGWFQRHNISVGTEIRTDRGTLRKTYPQQQQ